MRVRARPLYVELDQLHRDAGPSAAGQRIVEARRDPEHIETYSLWLRDQYMYGAAPEALYGLFYFDALIALHGAGRTDLYDASLHDTMLIMVFASSELLAHENVARCEEQPNGTRYRLYWQTGRGRGAYAQQVWNTMSTERRAFALRFARARVESAEARPPSRAACATGIRAVQAARNAGQCRRVRPTAEDRQDLVGGSQSEFELCEGHRYATFVDDETWANRRERIRTQYWDQRFNSSLPDRRSE